MRLLNKRGFDRVIAIDVEGPANATVHVVGVDSVTPDRPMIVIGRDQTAELRVLVTAPADDNPEKSIPVKFHVTDIGLGEVATATDNFVGTLNLAVESSHMTPAAPTSPQPLTGRKVLAMLIAFFGVVIGVNFYHDEACDRDLAGHRGRQRL